MARSSLAELIAELEAALRAIPKGVRALLGPGRASSAISPPEAHVTQFGDYEKVEESKFSPPAAPEPQEGELPQSYGSTRLVLLVTGAFRVHAYWEVQPEALSNAQAKLGGASAPSRAVLRFRGVSGPGDWFDIDVNLDARNWYVDLWSADVSCRADLGLMGSDGSFIALAESNPVHTPRAWPKPEVEEHFLRVDPAPKIETMPPPPPKPRMERRSSMQVDRLLEEVEAVIGVAATVGAGEAPQPEPPAMPPEVRDVLESKVRELYAYRQGQEGFYSEDSLATFTNPRPAADASIPPQPRPAGSGGSGPAVNSSDLTAVAEQKFAPGISSPAGQSENANE